MPVLRSVKNIVKNFTDAEVKVREATSNDPWGPSSTLMAEIADLTYNVVAFTEIMQMIWKRLNDHGKNWRHVYKSLTLLEYIMKTGSEKVAQQCKENIFAIQTLKDFQHLEDNKDLGANVREKAKALVALLKDDERLKNERAKALKAKERFTENFGIGSDSSSTQLGRPRHRPTHQESSRGGTLANPELEEARPHSLGEEELQLQLALAMSKEEAENDAKKQTNDELKLQLALEESKKSDQVKSAAVGGGEEHLLDFAGGASLGASNDPWNPAPTRVQTTSDPWGAPSVSQAQASPFSPVLNHSQPSDPWASTALPVSSAAVSSDPWDTTPAAPAVNDPWGETTTTSSSASPWAPNGSTAQKPPSIDDDFDVLGLRTAPTSQPSQGSGSNGADLFSMQSVSQSLPPMSQQAPKKPEDFLDQKAKTLVNLDSLITKPQTATGVVNPFAMTSVGANGGMAPLAANNNPFNAQQPPRPSLNQMSATNQMSGFNSGPTLMNPMMPSGYQQGYPAAQPMYQQQHQQQAYNMNNPFL